MGLNSELLKGAAKCRSKSDWMNFILSHPTEIQFSSRQELRSILRYLTKDPDFIYYHDSIFVTLIGLCRTHKCFEEGLELFGRLRPVCSPSVALEIAHLLLESSRPKDARHVALRALRQKKIDLVTEVRLRLLICNAFTEEGRYQIALKHFEPLENQAESQSLSLEERANFQVHIARIHFFNGNYPKAARHYELAAKFSSESGNEELAARSLFNTAASLHNAGHINYQKSYEFATQCLVLAQKNSFTSILAHVEAFFGLDAHLTGQFSKSRSHYENSLRYLPEGDNSYSRIHILSLLTAVYFEEANYSKGLEFANKTIELSASDFSDRYKTRLKNIEALCEWEAENWSRSYAILHDSAKHLKLHGISSNEDYNTWNHYLKLSAAFGFNVDKNSPEISLHIQNTNYHKAENLVAQANIQYNQRKFHVALKTFETIYEGALLQSNFHHQCLSLMGMIACKNALEAPLSELEVLVSRHGEAVSLVGNSPHLGFAFLVQANLEFRRGQISLAKKRLKQALQSHSLPAHLRLATNGWLDCFAGKLLKFRDEESMMLFEVATKFFFPVNLTWNCESGKLTSNFGIKLDFYEHPKLKEILSFLIQERSHPSSPEALFTGAWQESLGTQGWRQKLTNAISRLRHHSNGLPFPLVKQSHEGYFISDSFYIPKTSESNPVANDKSSLIYQYLDSKRATSQQISDELRIPVATVKRKINQLVKENKVYLSKVGRNIYYSSSHASLRVTVH